MNRNPLHPRTASLNQKDKHLAKQMRFNALEWLAKKFPEAFDNTTRIRPLKAGIMQDILDYADEALSQGISKTKLREAVVLFTRRVDYLTCLKAREVRVDLFGQPTVPVTEEEAERAAQKIKQRVEKAVKHNQLDSKKKKPSLSGNHVATPPTVRRDPAIIIKRKVSIPNEAMVITRLKEKLSIQDEA